MNIIADPNIEYSPEDLLRLSDDGKSYELIDGQLVERPMSMRSSRVASRLHGRLVPFVDERHLGSVFESEASYQCFPDHPKQVRKADLSFITAERMPLGQEPDGHCRIPPDLAVEIASPNDEFEDLLEKVEEYLSVGVRLVWVMSPRTRTIWVYRKDGSGILLREKDTLSGEDVLPGFSCPVRDLFTPPASPAPAP